MHFIPTDDVIEIFIFLNFIFFISFVLISLKYKEIPLKDNVDLDLFNKLKESTTLSPIRMNEFLNMPTRFRNKSSLSTTSSSDAGKSAFKPFIKRTSADQYSSSRIVNF